MRRIAPLAAVALIAAIATPIVVAQGGSAPGAPDKTRVTAGTYAADPGRTLEAWEVDHLGFSKYTGIFGAVTCPLAIDPANPPPAQVDVTLTFAEDPTAHTGLPQHLLRARKADRHSVV